jgi:uncharacterized protein (TIGR01777 family)
VRVALARFGIVLEKSGGALAKMWLPFKLCAGGPLGSGRQPFPWIHLADAVRAILFLVQEDLSGPVNLTAPDPPTNAEFSSALGKALHRPAFMPAPAFAVRIALGEMSTLLLDGQRALPSKLVDADFPYEHPDLADALAEIAAR